MSYPNTNGPLLPPPKRDKEHIINALIGLSAIIIIVFAPWLLFVLIPVLALWIIPKLVTGQGKKGGARPGEGGQCQERRDVDIEKVREYLKKYDEEQAASRNAEKTPPSRRTVKPRPYSIRHGAKQPYSEEEYFKQAHKKGGWS